MGKKRVDRVELNKYIQSLGLETYGIDLNHIVRNPMSNYRPVSALYTVGLQALFGLSMRHQIQDNLIDPTDPNSLSKKIDEFLKKDGPMIWPEPGPGEKRHLLKPQDGISYIRDLIYLRDCAILKERLLAILLCQGASSETDSEFYTMETHNDSETLEFDSDDTIAMDILGTKRGSIDKINDETASQRTESEEGETDNSFNESEDSVLDSRVTSQASNRNTNPSDPAFKVELRLYRSKKPRALVGPGTTWSYATLMLTERTKLCEDFFVLICDEIEADCSFAIFHLPEDMSMEDSVRIDRESRESELLFRRIRSILQRARVFPCGPLRRSVEVEVGLGTD